MKYLTFNSSQIRLFGDPQVYNNNDIPALGIGFAVRIESQPQTVERLPTFDVVPDFVDGWAFGGAIGIFLRNHGLYRLVINHVTPDGDHVSRSSCW